MRPGNSDSSVPNCSAITQRRVVRQHDAAGADANRRRAAGDVRDHDRRRRARDARHVVMLGQPEPVIAPALGVAREVEGVAERLRGAPAFDDRREIEDGADGIIPVGSGRLN